MKNQEIKKIEISKVDAVNLSSAKVSLKKGDQSIMELNSKEGKNFSRKDIYSIDRSQMGTEEQKIFRGKIRRKLRGYVNSIFGKDRTDNEKESAILEFLSFYRENWRITDFKIENFSSSKNPADLKDYKALLDFIKSTME